MTPDRLRLLKDISKTAKHLAWLIDQLVFEENETAERRRKERGFAETLKRLDEEVNGVDGHLISDPRAHIMPIEPKDGDIGPLRDNEKLSAGEPKGLLEGETEQPDGNNYRSEGSVQGASTSRRSDHRQKWLPSGET